MPDDAQTTSQATGDRPQAGGPEPIEPVAGNTQPAASTTPVPAASGAATKPARLPRKAPTISLFGLSGRMTLILLAVVAVIAGAALVAAIIHFADQMTEPIAQGTPKLGPEFEDRINNFVIRPPVNWAIEDHHDGMNIYLVGPKEPGYRPLVIASLEIKSGGMESYLREHKGRIEAQEKKEQRTVQWLGEESDSIDGCPHTLRLEYEWEMQLEGAAPVKVRTLQYIMEDKPRFYRVTCSVAADLYEKYLPKFEACARSFRRTPLPKPIAQPLPPEAPSPNR